MDAAAPRKNRLKDEASPYLLQHADNPVAWQSWGDAAFEAAKREDKAVLLSVGYAACHWCHVMAHESFEDPEIAELMNRQFINIKVDREERPDVDQIYQQALALMGEQGGWPLTIFLTPDGEPFWGGTYFPPQPSFGRPSFRQVLERMATVFSEEKKLVASNAELLRDALRRGLAADAAPEAGPQLTESGLIEAAQSLAGLFDPQNGGLGGAPKFLQAPILGLLWRAFEVSGDSLFKGAVLLTLRRVSRGGIYDHLGGGYARYAVDNRWLVPHFEKMLYDNALVLELLALSYQASGERLFEDRARATVGWLFADMRLEGGGFASALDADSEGREGAYYVWSKDEIEAVLGPDADFFSAHYGVSEAGNWEGVNILNELHGPGEPSKEDRARLTRCREKLLAVRGRRQRPFLDDKVLADWNGLMIAALARAGTVFEAPEWISAAAAAFDFVKGTMRDPEGGLVHSWRAGKLGPHAFLDDYAQMARAALALHAATGKKRYLAAAGEWAGTLLKDFAAAGGGFHLAPAGGEELILRARTAYDGPVPGGNAAAGEVMAKLSHLTGKNEYRAAAEGTLQAFAGEAVRNPAGFAGLWNAYYALAHAPQIVLIGKRSDPAVGAMLEALNRAPLCDFSLLVADDTAALPDGHPAAGKKGAPGTAFVCRGTTCSLPLADPDELLKELST